MPKVDISNITAEQRAQIIREERDVIFMAWQGGAIGNNILHVERLLNARIEQLGVKTLTGDTTERA